MELQPEAEQEAQSLLHELKSPLTAVCTFAELLRSQWGVLSEEDKLHKLDKILQYSLEAYAISRNKFPWAEGIRCNATTLASVHGIIDDLHQSYTTMVLSENFGPQAQAWTDPAVLGVVLQHLVDNAFRYRLPDTEISISVSCQDGVDEQGAAQAGPTSISIQNWGLPEYLDPARIFNFKEDSHLGLRIARRYIEQMGGRLALDQQLFADRCQITFTVWLLAEHQ